MASTPFKRRLQADGVYKSSTPVHAMGSDIGAGESKLFTLPTPGRLTRIVKRDDIAAVFSIAINQAEAIVDESDPTNNVWEEELGATEKRLTISDVLVGSLAIHSTAAVTYGEDFVVYCFA
jgi:hypothetical protein